MAGSASSRLAEIFPWRWGESSSNPSLNYQALTSSTYSRQSKSEQTSYSILGTLENPVIDPVLSLYRVQR